MDSRLEEKAKAVTELDADEMGIYHHLNTDDKGLKKPFRIVKPKKINIKKGVRKLISSDEKKQNEYKEIPIAFVETGVLNLIPGIEEEGKLYFKVSQDKKLYVLDPANQPKTRFRYFDGEIELGYTLHDNSPYPIDLEVNRLDEGERPAKTEYEEAKKLVNMKFSASVMNMDENQVKFLRLVALICLVGGFGCGLATYTII